jgi:segregation and condensation protein A
VSHLTTPYQTTSYTVSTAIYEGPLDLLLALIERAELDITRLALAQVTDQYLERLRSMEDHPAEEVSAFIVIASRLIQIKSEALLPRPPTREAGEEDPGEALARQLRLYKQFKLAALFLGEREEHHFRTHLRLAPPPKTEGRLDLSEITLNELIFAAYEIYEKFEPQPRLSSVVAPPKVTIREKIGQILLALRKQSKTNFGTMVPRTATRLEVVVTFLALLELIKRHIIQADQNKLFADIELEFSPGETPQNLDPDIELEFGE